MAEMASLDVVRGVLARWREPWRHYHDELHLAELKDHMLTAERDGVRIVDGAAALGFVLWHDAIYDPQSAHGRNEQLSAQLCSTEFATIAHPVSVERACEAILATIGHRPCDLALSPDVELLLDCDLAILGADPARFAMYDAAIRAEYTHVPEDVWNERRPGVLRSFLERERLYVTDWAHARWDGRSRKNLSAVGV
jgi:predicted metal-dependent HD superfamily phosphohydrolase